MQKRILYLPQIVFEILKFKKILQSNWPRAFSFMNQIFPGYKIWSNELMGELPNGLTLDDPCIIESYTEIKIKLDFYFSHFFVVP